MNSPARPDNDPDYGLPRFIERHGRGYVLAVTSAAACPGAGSRLAGRCAGTGV